jgi:hypothetical protein
MNTEATNNNKLISSITIVDDLTNQSHQLYSNTTNINNLCSQTVDQFNYINARLKSTVTQTDTISASAEGILSSLSCATIFL